MLAVGAIGEMGPIVILSVFLATDNDLASTILLFLFAAVAIATAFSAVRFHPARIARLIDETMHASGQLAVRICMLLLLALVYLAVELGQDLILGAFAAGLVLGYATRDAPALNDLWPKLDAIGYGLLIPFFFIRSGMTFDLDGLFESPASVAELPLFLALFLLVRGLPSILSRHQVPPGTLGPLALLSASALPLVVAITDVGVRDRRALSGHGRLDGGRGDALGADLPRHRAGPAQAAGGRGGRRGGPERPCRPAAGPEPEPPA